LVLATLYLHAKGIIIGDVGGAGVVGHWVGLAFWWVNIGKIDIMASGRVT
jgi:hypothetical protein